MPAFDTILFDFDGTLTPSLEFWVRAFEYALAEHGISLREDEILRRCFYRAYLDVAADLGIPPQTDPERDLGRLVEKGLAAAWENAELFPDALKVLEFCRRQGWATALVTSSPRPHVEAALVQLDLTSYLDVVVTGSDITHYKPHPEPVELALRQLDRKPAQALMIGDSTGDVLAGKAAGTATALFLPPSHARFYDFDELRATQPDFTFTSHAELLAYLNS